MGCWSRLSPRPCLPARPAATIRVLAAAGARAEGTGCRELAFVGVPDSVAGAYVFRNGFEAALRRSGWPPGAAGVSTPACRRRRDGERFVAGQ
jgi:hypothetical protein